jgi:hypothetical protein
MMLKSFIPSIHADELWKQFETHPALQCWLPVDLSAKDKVLAVLETRIRRNPGSILFAIMMHENGGGRGSTL